MLFDKMKYFLILLYLYKLTFSLPDNLIYKIEIEENNVQPQHKTSLLPMIDDSESWSYNEETNGPDIWHQSYPECDGRFQSPINFNTSRIIKKSYPKILLSNYKNIPTSINLINTGHSVQLELDFINKNVPVISGGPLIGEYQFEQLHFHWGSTNRIGSEHFVNNQQYAMEIHLVHFNIKYESFENAMDKPDGLTVLGYFFNVKKATPYITFAKYLDNIQEAHMTETIAERLITLSTLIGLHLDNFVTYSGSLTTPPCYESVQWILSTKIQYITPDEIKEFRKIYDEHENLLVNNFRPVQNINNRMIFYSGESSITAKFGVVVLVCLNTIILMYLY